MIRTRSIVSVLMAAFLAVLTSPLAAAPQNTDADFKGCKDHPLFTRMQDMRIKACRTVEQQ